MNKYFSVKNALRTHLICLKGCLLHSPLLDRVVSFLTGDLLMDGMRRRGRLKGLGQPQLQLPHRHQRPGQGRQRLQRKGVHRRRAGPPPPQQQQQVCRVQVYLKRVYHVDN